MIAADSPTSFLDDTPTARLIRQVFGAVSEFEKVMLVAKLKDARDRKRRSGVKVEGRKSIGEERPETVALARSLARADQRAARGLSGKSQRHWQRLGTPRKWARHMLRPQSS